MQPIDQLKAEIYRLDAVDIEIIYSDESVNEWELMYCNHQTDDLDIEATLTNLQKLSDNAGSSAFWASVVG